MKVVKFITSSQYLFQIPVLYSTAEGLAMDQFELQHPSLQHTVPQWISGFMMNVQHLQPAWGWIIPSEVWKEGRYRMERKGTTLLSTLLWLLVLLLAVAAPILTTTASAATAAGGGGAGGGVTPLQTSEGMIHPQAGCRCCTFIMKPQIHCGKVCCKDGCCSSNWSIARSSAVEYRTGIWNNYWEEIINLTTVIFAFKYSTGCLSHFPSNGYKLMFPMWPFCCNKAISTRMVHFF